MAIPQIGYVRIHQILEVIPVSRSAWYAGCKTGKYPKPVKLGENTTAWRAEDIHDLIKRINDAASKGAL